MQQQGGMGMGMMDPSQAMMAEQQQQMMMGGGMGMMDPSAMMMQQQYGQMGGR